MRKIYGMALLVGAFVSGSFVYGSSALADAEFSNYSTQTKWGTCTDPQTFNFTAATDDDLLIVSVNSIISGQPENVFFNSATMTYGGSTTDGTMQIHSYYLENPAIGDYDVVVDWAGSINYCHIHAVSFSGVDSFEVLIPQYDDADADSIIHTTTTNGVLYDFLGVYDDTGANWSPDSSQTTIVETLSGIGAGSYYKVSESEATSTYSFTGADWGRVSYVINGTATVDPETSATDTALLMAIKQSAQEIVFAFAILNFLLVGWGAFKLSRVLEKYER